MKEVVKMTSMLARTLLAGALALTVACSRGRPETSINPDAPITLTVDNQAFADMTIYVLESSRKVRLGLANGNSTTKFVLPKYLARTLTTLRFLADPIGGNRSPVSEEITVSPGDEITLRIPPA